jgi:hypothetical protein
LKHCRSHCSSPTVTGKKEATFNEEIRRLVALLSDSEEKLKQQKQELDFKSDQLVELAKHQVTGRGV